jgi:hypothetical protein
MRCPQVVSECLAPSEEMLRAALPENAGALLDAPA